MAYTQVVSIKVLCDAGREVHYSVNGCIVYYYEENVWQGGREPTTGLCALSLQPDGATYEPTPAVKQQQPTHHTTNNAYAMTSKESLIKYFH